MAIWYRSVASAASITADQAGCMPGYLGIEVVELGENWIALRMPVTERTRQPFGRLHGGASVVLAETAGSIAANLVLDPAKSIAVGLEINANHVRPVKDGTVYAKATAEALGETQQVWSIRVTDDKQRLVCVSRLTMAIIPADRA